MLEQILLAQNSDSWLISCWELIVQVSLKPLCQLATGLFKDYLYLWVNTNGDGVMNINLMASF